MNLLSHLLLAATLVFSLSTTASKCDSIIDASVEPMPATTVNLDDVSHLPLHYELEVTDTEEPSAEARMIPLESRGILPNWLVDRSRNTYNELVGSILDKMRPMILHETQITIGILKQELVDKFSVSLKPMLAQLLHVAAPGTIPANAFSPSGIINGTKEKVLDLLQKVVDRAVDSAIGRWEIEFTKFMSEYLTDGIIKHYKEMVTWKKKSKRNEIMPFPHVDPAQPVVTIPAQPIPTSGIKSATRRVADRVIRRVVSWARPQTDILVDRLTRDAMVDIPWMIFNVTVTSIEQSAICRGIPVLEDIGRKIRNATMTPVNHVIRWFRNRKPNTLLDNEIEAVRHEAAIDSNICTSIINRLRKMLAPIHKSVLELMEPSVVWVIRKIQEDTSRALYINLARKFHTIVPVFPDKF